MSTTSALIAQLRAMVALTNETPRIPALPRALATDAANRLEELERENAALKRVLTAAMNEPAIRAEINKLGFLEERARAALAGSGK